MIPRRFRVLFVLARALACGATAVAFFHGARVLAGPDELGQTEVRVFSPRTYDGHPQMWASATDGDGIVYFGNKGSVFEYDGAEWRRLPVGATLYVRALALAPDGRIYVGAVDELGYLEADRFGRKRFVSLRTQLAPEDRDFGAIWNIVAAPDGVYFGAGSRVLRWHDGRFQVWRDPNPQASQRLAGRDGLVFVKLVGGPLERLAGGTRATVSADPRLQPLNLVAAWPDGDAVMVVTTGDGVWRVDASGTAAPWPTEADAELRRPGALLSATRLADGGIALGTVKDGLLLLDAAGRFVRRVGLAEGLPNALVRTGAEDRSGGLWLGTNRGPAWVSPGGTRTFFGPGQGLPATVTGIMRHGGQLHVSTIGGTFRLRPRDPARLTNARFEPLAGLELQPSFALASVPDGLLVAENNRLLVRPDTEGKAVETLLPSPTVLGLAASPTEPGVWWGASGSGGGLTRIARHDGRWQAERPYGGVAGNFHGVAADARGDVWLASASRGVWRVEFGPAPAAGAARPVARVTRFGPGDGLPGTFGEVGVDVADGEPFFLIDGVRWQFDRALNRPTPTPAAARAGRAAALSEGKVRWFSEHETLDRIDEIEVSPEIPARALIRGASVGADRPWPEDGRLEAGRGEVSFAFTAAPGGRPVELQSRLRGFDEDWGEPGTQRRRTYTNLPAGAYVFAVRAREESGAWGPEATLAFSIRPNWWATGWARAGAALLLAAGVGGFVRWRGRALRLRNAQLEEIVARRTADLSAARDAADAANRAKSAFLTHMSHELRTPLNGILGYAQLMRREPDANDAQRARAGIITRSGEHLLNLINDVLDLARIEAGHHRLNEADGDLRAIVRSATELIRDRAEAKGLAFAVEFGDGLPAAVRTDEQKLRQVLLNLLGNAVKFTAGGGVTLRVRAAADDGASRTPFGSRAPFGVASVEFAVHDTGPGIPAEKQREIFRPFASSETGQGQGTGLGLALSQRLVALLGGELRVDSEPGRGSRFFFQLKLPLAASGAESATPARPVVGYEGNCRHLIVADDDAVARTALRQMLEGVGFSVDEAATSADLHARLAVKAPALVLLEMRLANSAARAELIGAIRTRPGGAAPLVVAMSARAFPLDRSAALAAGCDEFLAKPVVETHLWDVVGRSLGLNWRFGEVVAATDESAALPGHLVAELDTFVARGDVTGLRAALARLRDGHPDQAGFIAGLEQLAATYDLERLGERLRGRDNKPGSPS